MYAQMTHATSLIKNKSCSEIHVQPNKYKHSYNNKIIASGEMFMTRKLRVS